jgi:hypothetical protein
VLVWLSACVSPQATQAVITVNIIADGQTNQITLPAGSTVQQALNRADLTLNASDRSEPPAYTVLGDGSDVQVIRVTEKIEYEQEVIPYEQQIVYNESMPSGKEVHIQWGQNGLREVTYRRVYEDGVEVSSKPLLVNSITLKEPVPQIIMVGIQTPLKPVSVPGRLFYLRDGNVWMIENTTANRRAVLTTGDLDGRIFTVSSDGSSLLITRHADEEDQINSLWAADVNASLEASSGAVLEESPLIDLQVPNIIHFADWLPGSNTRIVFSTVEPRQAPPGWQANNDLQAITFSDTGWTTQWTTIIEPNFGGVYGWWGTSYLWGPDGRTLAFARPDAVGTFAYPDGTPTTLLEITPLFTRGDWAWVPGITWGPDGNTLFTAEHVFPPGSTAPEESQDFDLTAVSLAGAPTLQMVSQTGMFSYPIASPLQSVSGGITAYQIAYLQAIFPEQSETSRYRLTVMDRDGSNRRGLFPAEGRGGLVPQQNWGAWSPAAMPETGNYAVAVLYQGNLWFVDVVTGEALQITSDGLTTRIIWK